MKQRSVERTSKSSNSTGSQLNRRAFLSIAAAAGAVSAGSRWGLQRVYGAEVPLAAGTKQAGPTLAKFPEKTELILRTDRPPNLETPIRFFREDLTPNDAFYVRWHLGVIPTTIDTKTYRLKITGHLDTELSLSLDDIRKNFEAVSVIAVNQCSGNSRSFFSPRVPGGQWENGAMGNAKWTGVRLADLLKKAGVKAGAVEVSFAGLDRSPVPSVQPFVKSLDYKKAADPDVIVAYAMNDQPLPMLNGFPLRLVVPGWYATYWVKALSEINVLNEKFHGFWMDKAYRIPTTPNMMESPTDLAKETVPINAMTCRSLFVRPEPEERVIAGKPYEIEGVAIDSGKGITKVEISADGGKTWNDAKLDKEMGRFSWRRFRYSWQPAGAGSHKLMARATNAAGETQSASQWNRSGYGRNVVESVTVTAV